MRSVVRTRLVAAALALSALGVTGCTAEAEPVLKPAEVVGGPFQAVWDAVGDEATLLVQDSSPRVDREPTFTDQEPAGWVVVAACADDADLRQATSVEVAVIPEDTFTTDVREDLEAGEYTDAVDCEGRECR
ncbi:MAG: hypothetical protein ACQEW8_04420 [Actinomycetota bacterium]